MCSNDEWGFEMQSDDEYGVDDDYYNKSVNECEMKVNAKNKVVDSENCELECLSTDKVEKLLNDCAEAFAAKIHVASPIAKFQLRNRKWAVGDVAKDIDTLLIDSRIKPSPTKPNSLVSTPDECPVSFEPFAAPELSRLQCGRSFCISCCIAHFEMQLGQGVSTETETGCMHTDCKILVPEDFGLDILRKSNLRKIYKQFALRDCVSSRPEPNYRKWAVGDVAKDMHNLLIDSRIVLTPDEHRVCFEPFAAPEFPRLQCGHSFCISCCLAHFEMQLGRGVSAETECMHTDCKILVRDCVSSHPEPNYRVVIRAEQPKSKRVTCNECDSSFCFNCGSDYHAPTDCATMKKWLAKCDADSGNATKDCPKREANPTKTVESEHEARVITAKYLFYFDRWSNHAKSLRLEHEALEKVRQRIEQKVMNKEGTWIDWQYLFDAAAVLAKCRYTMQYTYSLAYFMEDGKKKELFQYQQAQLESAIEKLSWEIENVETTGRGGVVSLMAACERSRATLLEEFGDEN